MNVGGEGGGKSGSQDFDLNLAPIIDCFTVLITFMLVSASFLSIGILEAGVGAPAQSSESSKPPEIALEVEMQPDFRMKLKVSGRDSRTIDLASQGGTWDFSGLNREISGIQQKWPQTHSLVLSATNDIEYLHIVQCMEKLHQVVPDILLGGF